MTLAGLLPTLLGHVLVLPLDVPTPTPSGDPSQHAVRPLADNGFAANIVAAFLMVGLIVLASVLLNRRPH